MRQGRGEQLSPPPPRTPERVGQARPRSRDLPFPVLIVLAIGAVAAERLRRRGPLLVLSLLMLCVAVGGIGLRLAGQTTVPLAQPLVAAHTVTPTSAVAPADIQAIGPTSAVAIIPAAAQVVAPTATVASAPTATATMSPSATLPVIAAPTRTTAALPANGGGGQNTAPTLAPIPQPIVVSGPAMPTLPPPQARGTTVIPILMYHYVRVVNNPQDQIGINLSVKPELFAAQMQYLADKGYTTLTMREVHAILAGQQPLPPKPIALTFDDGYRDFYTAAWPTLQRHGFKATNYVVTDFIGWDAYMTWPMLQELDATGQVEIGAHTRSHPDLRALGKERRWDEIAGSKAILEEGLGRPTVSFCYPAGFFNDGVLDEVQRARFLTAVTTQAGTKQHLQWAYALPRVRVNGPDSLATWASRLP